MDAVGSARTMGSPPGCVRRPWGRYQPWVCARVPGSIVLAAGVHDFGGWAAVMQSAMVVSSALAMDGRSRQGPTARAARPLRASAPGVCGVPHAPAQPPARARGAPSPSSGSHLSVPLMASLTGTRNAEYAREGKRGEVRRGGGERREA